MQKIINKINTLASQINRPVTLMELCGTHSQTVAKYGLKSLLPPNVELISGPGCPICVTDQTDIDVVIGLAENDVPIAVYGDALSLPGTNSSLEKLRQQGKKIEVVYSTLDAVKLAEQINDLAFFGIGFETTTPMSAWAIKQGLKVYSAHKLFPPAMAALLSSPNIQIDGFLDPGHVAAIIGEEPFKQFNVPQVISGFEPEDVLLSIQWLLEMIVSGKNELKNEYTRVVRPEGNIEARKLINEVFEISDARWRGLGNIPNSGLKIRKEFQNQDTEFIHHDLIENIRKNTEYRPSACICGKILQGLAKPADCPLFAKICTPENPQGACMVSVEGSCQIEYKYKNSTPL
ncbi:MAG TPA: hydrogenase formation protein HypD [Candidatus Bipolaricaulota bacterium]|nr:hydrogenase formation protein HypD [Candidatus Bipolaricaulota bacterium]